MILTNQKLVRCCKHPLRICILSYIKVANIESEKIVNVSKIILFSITFILKSSKDLKDIAYQVFDIINIKAAFGLVIFNNKNCTFLFENMNLIFDNLMLIAYNLCFAFSKPWFIVSQLYSLCSVLY